MSMVVRTNVSSMTASRQLSRTNRDLGKTLDRISSGLRVVRAADDAAGLGVATNLETAAISIWQAMRNTNDGISIIQMAEGAANEVTDILQRIRELAVQSASQTLGNDERQFIQSELTEMRDEIARIAATTEFNGVSLADGTTTQLAVQVGITNASNSRITIDLGDLTTTTLGLSTIDLSSVTSARSALDVLDEAIDSVNEYRSGLGSVQNRLDSSLRNSEVYTESLSAAQSQIRDADFAYETSEMTKLQIMQQAGVAALAQAKNMNQSVVSLLQ